MPARHEVNVGYAQVDDKGRLPLTKPVRQALGISAGSTVAYVKIGDALIVIPQDMHLTEVMGAAMRVMRNARLSADDLLATLPEARDESVIAHYGADFMNAFEIGDAEPPHAPATR